LFEAVFIISLFSIFARASGFLFRIYLANKIGSESLGLYQIGFSVYIVFATAVSTGLPLTLSKLTAKYRVKKDYYSESNAVSASVIISLFISLCAVLFLLLFKAPFTKILSNEQAYSVLLILSPAIFATALLSSFRGSLWGQKKHLIISAVELVEQASRILFAVILIEFAIFNLNGAISAGLALTISCFISASIAGYFYYRSKGRLLRPEKKYYKQLVKRSAPITGVRVASSLIQLLIAILIPLRLVAAGYTQSQALSQLGIALGMTFPLLFLPITVVGALSVAIIPEISTFLHKNNTEQLNRHINSSLIFSIFAAFLIIPFYMGAGIHIGRFLFNNATSGIYLSQAALVMVPLSLTSITASILNALNLEVKSFKNYIIGSALLIVCLWFLPKYLGIRALILGMGICMSVVSILNLKLISKKVDIRQGLMKTISLMVMFVLPASLFCKFSYQLLYLVFPSFICLAISGCLSVVMFVLLCIIFNIANLDLWVFRLKNTFISRNKNKVQTKTA